MCSSLSNFVVFLKILRIVVPFNLILFGLVLLYDRKKIYSKEEYLKKRKKYIIMFIISAAVFLITSLVILLINSPGVCDGRFLDIGSDYSPKRIHYTHFIDYINIFSISIFIIYIICSATSKKNIDKKGIFIPKLLELLFVICCLIISLFLFHTIPNKNDDRWTTSWKPIMYIYPNEEMDLKITFNNKDNLMHTYPKYKDEWNIHVSTDGNIYDYDTNRNYYALYWDEKDYQEENFNEGFVVKGEDVSKFFEEKLEILGFNEREINEFIIYWMPKMEDNKYNLIKFRTTDEINENMPIDFSIKPDTLIRVIMDYKKLDNKIEIKEQILPEYRRQGFTIVEWGGRELD